MAKRLTNDEFIRRSKIIHNNYYEYLDDYKSAHSKIKIICPIHGEFEQKAYSHLQGIGCPKCGFAKSSDSSRKKIEDFIKQSNIVHKNRYRYNDINYTNNKTNIKIECPIHGFFYQLPQHHINGHGCPKCASKKDIKSNNIFVEQANRIHNGKYKYEYPYEGSHKLLKITCLKHGIFEQTPNSHLKGRGCPGCQVSNSSKLENIWLDLLGIDKKHRNIRMIIDDKIYKFDAFIEESNTIYEFYGDFWHGNPKMYKDGDYNLKNNILFSELYKSTIEREKYLISKEYKVVSIWENDFIENNKQIINQRIKQYK